jgi:hypothetical protein
MTQTRLFAELYPGPSLNFYVFCIHLSWKLPPAENDGHDVTGHNPTATHWGTWRSWLPRGQSVESPIKTMLPRGNQIKL